MAETWVLNATISLPSSSLSGTFTSNGKSFTGIKRAGFSPAYLSYTSFAGGTTDSTQVYENGSWINDAYRTLVFDTTPSGNMLTWLQANGQKQSEPGPEPETPANVCLVNGTAYGVKTGQTLVNGTVQTIYNSRTLVGGTGYDIVLSTNGFTVTITGNGAPASGSINAYVIINGVSYTAPATLTVEAGTTIEAYAKSPFKPSLILLNGEQIREGTKISYEHPVTTNTNVKLSRAGSGIQEHGIVAITTT